MRVFFIFVTPRTGWALETQASRKRSRNAARGGIHVKTCNTTSTLVSGQAKCRDVVAITDIPKSAIKYYGIDNDRKIRGVPYQVRLRKDMRGTGG
jgi:hypothetical protein